MARHSCGHKAGPFTPSSAVRAMPRCTSCQAQAELAAKLAIKARQLALLFPDKSSDQIANMLIRRAGVFRGMVNPHKLIAAADDIISAHAAHEPDMEEDYVETFHYTV